MAVVEYAYFDGEVKGNSRVAMAYIEAVRELAVNAEVSELAFSSGEFSAILLTSPIVIFVMVKGSMADAKLQARKILREIGVERKTSLDDIFELAEEIENLPIEEVIKKVGKG